MLHASGMPKKLWAESCNIAVYILNRTGPIPVTGKTPLEMLTGSMELSVTCVFWGQNVMCALPNRKGASGLEEYFQSFGRKRIETELSASSDTCDKPATWASGVLQVLPYVL